MKINFHKCDLVFINAENSEAQTFAQILSCKIGIFPLSYLGAPLHYKKLRKEVSQPIVDKVMNKVGVGEAIVVL
jgi:hypothetical protein